MAQAYRVQREVLNQLASDSDPIIGHKAGLTSRGAQTKFDTFEPVAGSFLKSQLKNTATYVPLRNYKALRVEMEIGFELKLSIRTAPKTVEELKSKVRHVVPIVELPNLHYADPSKLAAADIIASNVAASLVIKGRPKPVDRLDLNAVSATLTRNKEELTTGTGSDALGDQWEALLWLVQNRLRYGYEVKRGDLLITGALGQMVQGKAGRYVADFGSLGQVTFNCR